MSIPFSVQDIISRDGDTNDLDNATVCARVTKDLYRCWTDGDGPNGWTVK